MGAPAAFTPSAAEGPRELIERLRRPGGRRMLDDCRRYFRTLRDAGDAAAGLCKWQGSSAAVFALDACEIFDYALRLDPSGKNDSAIAELGFSWFAIDLLLAGAAAFTLLPGTLLEIFDFLHVSLPPEGAQRDEIDNQVRHLLSSEDRRRRRVATVVLGLLESSSFVDPNALPVKVDRRGGNVAALLRVLGRAREGRQRSNEADAWNLDVVARCNRDHQRTGYILQLLTRTPTLRTVVNGGEIRAEAPWLIEDIQGEDAISLIMTPQAFCLLHQVSGDAPGDQATAFDDVRAVRRTCHEIVDHLDSVGYRLAEIRRCERGSARSRKRLPEHLRRTKEELKMLAQVVAGEAYGRHLVPLRVLAARDAELGMQALQVPGLVEEYAPRPKLEKAIRSASKQVEAAESDDLIARCLGAVRSIADSTPTLDDEIRRREADRSSDPRVRRYRSEYRFTPWPDAKTPTWYIEAPSSGPARKTAAEDIDHAALFGVSVNLDSGERTVFWRPRGGLIGLLEALDRLRAKDTGLIDRVVGVLGRRVDDRPFAAGEIERQESLVSAVFASERAAPIVKVQVETGHREILTWRMAEYRGRDVRPSLCGVRCASLPRARAWVRGLARLLHVSDTEADQALVWITRESDPEFIDS